MKIKKLAIAFVVGLMLPAAFTSCGEDEKEEWIVPLEMVTNLTFQDTDPEAMKIGGTVSWTLPASEANITGYVVYAGKNDSEKTSKIGEVLAGTATFEIPAGTEFAPSLFVVAKNAVGEALRAATLTVSDFIEEKKPVTVGLYILNRGNYNANNASISYYDVASAKLTPEFYKTVNGKALGSDAEQMFVYGSKMYVSVTSSNRIVVLDVNNGKELKSLTPKNAAGEPVNPRCFTALDGKVYVSYYYGSSVAVLDTASLNIEKEIPLGTVKVKDKEGKEQEASRYPEQLTAANGKVYVALSEYGAGKYVAMIDPASAKVEKEIEVVQNPCNLTSDSQGNVYVISMGDYGAIKNTLQRIDAAGKVSTVANGSKMTLVNDKLYVVYAQWGDPNITFKKYDALTGKVEVDKLITDGTVLANPNSIDVDPLTGKIYISNAPYGETATMFVFSPEGKKEGEAFDTGGYDTQKVVFIAK